MVICIVSSPHPNHICIRPYILLLSQSFIRNEKMKFIHLRRQRKSLIKIDDTSASFGIKQRVRTRTSQYSFMALVTLDLSADSLSSFDCKVRSGWLWRTFPSSGMFVDFFRIFGRRSKANLSISSWFLLCRWGTISGSEAETHSWQRNNEKKIASTAYLAPSTHHFPERIGSVRNWQRMP